MKPNLALVLALAALVAAILTGVLGVYAQSEEPSVLQGPVTIKGPLRVEGNVTIATLADPTLRFESEASNDPPWMNQTLTAGGVSFIFSNFHCDKDFTFSQCAAYGVTPVVNAIYFEAQNQSNGPVLEYSAQTRSCIYPGQDRNGGVYTYFRQFPSIYQVSRIIPKVSLQVDGGPARPASFTFLEVTNGWASGILKDEDGTSDQTRCWKLFWTFIGQPPPYP